jgi:hypothetical protein
LVRAVYIAGLEHSGTTVLELLLSCHARVCGLGEVMMWTEPGRARERLASLERRRCSCGLGVAECPLWQGYVRYLQANGEGATVENYRHLIGVARQALGPDIVCCDSSKSATGLRNWVAAWEALGVPREDLLVVHIAKDARNWVASERARHGHGLLGVFRRFSLWGAANVQIADAIAAQGLRCLSLGYEQLCFDSAGSIERLCDAMGLAADPGMQDLRRTHAHVGAGNGSRLRAQGAPSLRYDYRWYFEWAVNFCFLLRPGIRRLNRRFAYPVTPT